MQTDTARVEVDRDNVLENAEFYLYCRSRFAEPAYAVLGFESLNGSLLDDGLTVGDAVELRIE